MAQLSTLGLMKSRTQFFIAAVVLPLSLLLVVGCLPLRQEALVKGPDYQNMSLCNEMALCSGRYLLAGIDMNHEKIVVEKSYIENPSGKRYTFQVEPHQFDIDRKFGFMRADVYHCKANGSRLWHWPNGIWSVHLVMETNGVPRIIDQQWKYWTFYYCHIIHGAPN